MRRRAVYAFGLMICVALTGCNPFPSRTTQGSQVANKVATTQETTSGTRNSAGSTAIGAGSTTNSSSNTPHKTNSNTTTSPTGLTQTTHTTTQHHSLMLSLGSQGPEVEKLQQLLCVSGYLPLVWTSTKSSSGKSSGSSGTAATGTSSVNPSGTWTWKYSSTPATLKALWSPTKYSLVTKSAVMTFEEVHHLSVDGIAGPQVFAALNKDVSSHKRNPYGFTFVDVSLKVPQSLTLWHDGRTILKSAANGGIPQSPTVTGTYPVYLQYLSQTMKGTNPDGTHYSDPGVPYVSYFYRSEAVHGFVRAHYGSPQSLGCVELPVNVAKVVWPYMHLGTLVHIS